MSASARRRSGVTGNVQQGGIPQLEIPITSIGRAQFSSKSEKKVKLDLPRSGLLPLQVVVSAQDDLDD